MVCVAITNSNVHVYTCVSKELFSSLRYIYIRAAVTEHMYNTWCSIICANVGVGKTEKDSRQVWRSG